MQTFTLYTPPGTGTYRDVRRMRSCRAPAHQHIVHLLTSTPCTCSPAHRALAHQHRPCTCRDVHRLQLQSVGLLSRGSLVELVQDACVLLEIRGAAALLPTMQRLKAAAQDLPPMQAFQAEVGMHICSHVHSPIHSHSDITCRIRNDAQSHFHSHIYSHTHTE